MRARGVFAARAGVAFALSAVALGAFYFFTYEVLTLSEPARYAFWVFVGSIFVAICGASSAVFLARRSARLSVFVSAVLGFIAGVFWAFAATVPVGLFPGRFDTPIIVIWPLSGMFALAYAAAAQPRIAREHRGALGIGGLLALLALGWTYTVKNGFDRLGANVDFARMAIRRYEDPSGLGIGALPRGSCWDPAPSPQPVAVDSNAVLTDRKSVV